MEKKLSVTLKIDANTGAVTAVRNSFDALDKSVQKTNTGASSVLGLFGRFASVGSVAYLAKEALGVADSYSLLEGQLKNVTTTQQQLTAAEQGIFAISQATRTEVGATTKLYVSLSGALGQMGKSQKDVLTTTDLVNKAIAISGSTTQQSQAAITQFGQALGSGKLGGDELVSLLENSRGLAQALADGLGVPIGALKGMGEQGKLTSDVLVNALGKSADSITTKFANVPVTIGQSFTQITNSVGGLVDEWNEATGTTNTLASWGTGLSEFITKNKVDIIEFGRDVGRVFQLMGTYAVAGLQIVRAGFYTLVVGLGEGINSIADGWNTLTVGMQNAFKGFADATGQIFYDVINFILGKISDTINSVSNGLAGALSFIGVDNPFGQISLSVGEYTSSIKVATKSTSELINLDWSKSVQKDALDASNNALDTGAKLWDEIASNTTKATVAVDASTVAGNANTNAHNANAKAKKESSKATKEHKQQVEDLSGAYRDFLELTGQETKLFALDAQKQLAELTKLFDKGLISDVDLGNAYDGIWKKHIEGGKEASKEIALDFSQQFQGVFDGLINGDLGGAISGLFSGISQEMSKGLISSLSTSLSSGISSLFGGLGSIGGGLVGIGIGLLGSLFGGDTEETPPVLDDLARTSESTANALEDIKNVQNPLLALTHEMTRYLSNIDKAFGGIENSLIRSNLDLSGSTYQGTSSAGFLGLTGKSSELFGTSINVAGASINDLLSGYVSATLNTVSKNVKKGLFKTKTSYSTVSTDISAQIGSYLAQATQSAFDSLTLSGNALGISTAGLANQSISIGTFDTTGKSAAEVSAELEGRFSAQLDAITEQYFGAVSEFQLGGEGLAETLYRVTINFEQVGHSLGLIGKSVDYRTANIIADYAGGIDKLNSSLSDYTQNFFSEQEQHEQQIKTLTASFSSLGQTLPSSNEAFRALIESINTTTDDGAKLFGELIGLSGSFADATAAGKELSSALEEQQKSIRDSLLNTFSTLKNQAQGFLDSLRVSGADEGTTYKFYAQRYNDLKAELSGYFDASGVVNEGADLEKLQATYNSLQSVAGNLGTSSQALPTVQSGVSAVVTQDFTGYVQTFESHESAIQNILTRQEKHMQDLVYLTELQANEIRAMKKEIIDLNEKTA